MAHLSNMVSLTLVAVQRRVDALMRGLLQCRSGSRLSLIGARMALAGRSHNYSFERTVSNKVPRIALRLPTAQHRR
jgi:hypothetical protein